MNRGVWIIHVVPHFRREFANRLARGKETANIRPIRIGQTADISLVESRDVVLFLTKTRCILSGIVNLFGVCIRGTGRCAI